MKGCKAEGGVCIGGDQCIKFMRCAMGGSLPGATLDPKRPTGFQPRRNGCHNRPAPGVKRTVQDGYYQEYVPGTVMPLKPQFTLVPHAMSTDCQYTSSEAGRVDPGCTGCRWRAP